MRVKCLVQEYNTMSPASPELEPGQLDPETNAQTMRLPRLISHQIKSTLKKDAVIFNHYKSENCIEGCKTINIRFLLNTLQVIF